MAIVDNIPELAAGDSIQGFIPIHWIKKFEQDVFHLAQETGSKLMSIFKQRSLLGAESLRVDFYEQRSATRRNIGRKTGSPDYKRNTPVIYTPQEMGSVVIAANAVYDADIFDKFDLMRQNHDVMANVKKASGMAIGREMDDILLESFKGKQVLVPTNANNSNETVNNWISYGASLWASDGVFGGESPAPASEVTGLNLEALLMIKQHMLEKQVASLGQEIMLTVRTKDLMSLLRDPKLQSYDYNTVRALVDAETDYFAGIRFIRIDHGEAAAVKYQNGFQVAQGTADPLDVTSLGMNLATGYAGPAGQGAGWVDSVIDDPTPANVEAVGLVAFVKDTPLGGGSLEIGMEMGVTSKFDVIPELFHSTQYLTETSFGASRMDPKATLQVLVKA